MPVLRDVELMVSAPRGSNQHPTEAGHAKIAGFFEAWLEKWGLEPEANWPIDV